MWQNKRQLFAVLFEASAATLLEVAADPKHLGARIGLLSILHTWGRSLQPHRHSECVVPGGGRSPDPTHWISSPSHFFLPRQGAQPCLPRQVRCRTATRFSQPPTRLLRRVSAARQRKELHRLAALTVPAGLGRLCQAARWWTGTRSALSRALYPSRRHLQPSPALGLRLRGCLPLEGRERTAASSAP